MREEVKIPKERIAVLIGEKGATKRNIQRRTRVKITVNTKEEEVSLDGENSLDVFLAMQIVKAIGRGVNPDIALNLINENFQMEILNLKDFSGPSKKNQDRIRARAIGTGGKARLTLEHLTNTNICIYGKTIVIIGAFDGVSIARRAVEKLLKGAPHSNVYRWIEKQKAIERERI